MPTEEELALLSPKEREGLEADDAEGVEDGEGGEGGEGDEDTAAAADAAAQAEGEAATTDAAEAAAAADEAATAAAAQAEDDDDDDEAEELYQPRPIPNWQAPEGAKERLTAIDTRKDELLEKFEDGEITRAEYTKETRALDTEREDLKEKLSRAAIAGDMVQTEWIEGTVASFFKKHTEYKGNELLLEALDKQVRARQDGTVNLGKYNNPFDPRIIVDAHKAVLADLQRAMGLDPQPKPKKETKTGEAPPKTKIPKRPAPPPSLAHAAAEDMSDISDGGEFAHLDRLATRDPAAYEKALAGMSTEARDRYLASA